MMRKTITISEEAYSALKQVKHPDESFTRAILRLTRTGRSTRDLLTFLKQLGPQDELANAIEAVYRERHPTTLRQAQP